MKISKNDFDGYLKFKSTKKFILKTDRKAHLLKLKKKQLNYSKIINIKKNTLHRACPICYKKKSKFLFNKYGFKHVECKNCKFIFVNPILKDTLSSNEIINENSYNKVLNNKHNKRLDNIKFNYGIQKIGNLKKKKILDYGCGLGFFLDIAKKQGAITYGSEVNKYCNIILKKKNIPNINIDNFKRNYFDIITLWTVLEHIPNPKNLLRNLKKIIKKNGKILILVPNIESLSARILREKCSMFSGEQHINFFSASTLTKILHAVGFKIEHLETVISDLGSINNYLNYYDPYFDSAKDLKIFNVNYINKKKLGYILLCIAKKK
jgi:2-polyprenyl-3-methyl-5-hydroxy-6-metoxy-1,4-benzoquinol methylase